MKFILFICTFAATIQEILSGDDSLSTAAAVGDPLWSQPGQISVLVPTNNAIASASEPLGRASGTITFNRFIGLDATYALIADKNDVFTLVWNNGSPGTSSSTSPNIEVRNGLGFGRVTQVQVADNGILYISDNIALAPPARFIKTLTALRCNLFVSLIESVGLTSFINGLNNVTIFAPTDAGFRTRASVINGLSASQKRAYVFSVIVPQIIYTDNIKSGDYDTLLASNKITISASIDGAIFPGSGYEDNYVFSQADNFCQGGVIQRLDFWLRPNNLPGPSDPVTPVNVPSGSANFESGQIQPSTDTQSSSGDSNMIPQWLTTISAAFAMIM